MSDLPDRLIGALAGRYSIEHELGRGGMATVYLARDIKHDRDVAIKVLRPELAATLGAERFLREIQIAAKLTHPHILALYDSGEAAGFLYYVMPYIEGESLRDRLSRERQLPIEDAVGIASEVAAALSHAHGLGVIHRDIKPENILLSAGEAVVADFGIARAVSVAGGDQLTETGMAVGTPAYMSPEQATAEEVDGRSDIYSLACVLYEMLAGEPPFSGTTAEQIIRKHLSAEVTPLTIVRPTVPKPLSLAVGKALAKTAADRFATAHDFAEALRAPAMPPGATGEGQKVTGAPKVIAAMVAFLAVVTIGWWAVTSLLLHGDKIERMVVLRPTSFMGDSAPDYFVDGMHDEMISRLNQIPDLEVVSRTTALRFSNAGFTATEIASELEVDAVLESSVLLWGDSVRIQVQLIDGFPKERHRWQDTFDKPFSDFLALHSEVALAVAEQIRITLTPRQQAQITDTREVDPQVQEAVLVANHLLSTFNPDNGWRAVGLLQRAIEIDSTYAPVHAWLAHAHRMLGFWWGVVPPHQAYPPAIAAVEKALALDSALPHALMTLGRIRFEYLWDWAAADIAMKRAIELDPNSAYAHHMYSNYLRAMGRNEEAMSHLLRAVDLDPHWPMNYGELWCHYYLMDEPQLAREAVSKALELDSAFTPGYWALGFQSAAAGNLDASIDYFRRAGEDAMRAIVHINKGEAEIGRLILDSLIQSTNPGYNMIARVHAALGEDDAAFVWLERGFTERESGMVWLKSWRTPLDPFVRLQEDPRFQDLLRRMDFPEP